MRTLHIDTGRDLRGGQWQVLYLLEGLQRANQPAVLLAREGSPLFDEARKRGLDVRPVSFLSIRSCAAEANVVHAHDARSHTLAAFALASMPDAPPLIVARRVAFPVKTGAASKWKYGRAAMFIAVSQFVAAKLGDAGIPHEKIRVVYDGIPIPEISSPGKRIPGRVLLLNKTTAPLSLPGDVQDVQSLTVDLATASVFVYVSELEGLGSGVLAAMAAGVPVVACGWGGLPETLGASEAADLQTGWLVTREEIPQVVQRLLNDPEQATALGLKGRARALDYFSRETMTEGTLRVYEEVLA
jgi:glycosyltransferase involved in cell wall biosynthesis